MRPLLLVLLLAPLAFGQGDPSADIRPLVDSSLAQEKKLYWLKCQQALQGRRDYRRHALQGLALFLANVPLEYAASTYRHVRKAEPVELNLATFVLMSASLLHFSLSYRANEEYERGRTCCRFWQGFTIHPGER